MSEPAYIVIGKRPNLREWQEVQVNVFLGRPITEWLCRMYSSILPEGMILRRIGDGAIFETERGHLKPWECIEDMGEYISVVDWEAVCTSVKNQ